MIPPDAAGGAGWTLLTAADGLEIDAQGESRTSEL